MRYTSAKPTINLKQTKGQERQRGDAEQGAVDLRAERSRQAEEENDADERADQGGVEAEEEGST